MSIGDSIRRAREVKGLSQKEVAAILKMDQSQYSKIEKGKVDPQFSTVEKIAKAIKVSVVDLVAADTIFKEIAAYDKTLVEKLQLVEQLEEQEKKSVFSIIDSLLTKKKLKDTLAAALAVT